MAEIEVLQPGLFSTIQDTGRFGAREYGVPQGGAMDTYASRLANLLLENPTSAAVLEITQNGPKLRFSSTTTIAITGGMLSPELNHFPVENNQVLSIEAGDILSFGRRVQGCRGYIGIKNGFHTEEVLGSRSWFEGITSCGRLNKGMRLEYEETSGMIRNQHAVIRMDNYLGAGLVESVPGPEFDRLTTEEGKNLGEMDFHIGGNNNRMGIQLEEKFVNSLDPILTGPVLPGTVQLTQGGKVIVLMKDGQTTGGYPRILQLTEKGMNTIAQKVMGEKLRFRIGDSFLGT